MAPRKSRKPAPVPTARILRSHARRAQDSAPRGPSSLSIDKPGVSILRRKKPMQGASAAVTTQTALPALSKRRVNFLTPSTRSQRSTKYTSTASSLSKTSTLVEISPFSGAAALSGTSTLYKTFPLSGTPSSSASLFGSSALDQKNNSSDGYPLPTLLENPLTYYSYYQSSSMPLSRQASAAPTLVESPDSLGQEFPSYGTLGDLAKSLPEVEIDMERWAQGASEAAPSGSSHSTSGSSHSTSGSSHSTSGSSHSASESVYSGNSLLVAERFIAARMRLRSPSASSRASSATEIDRAPDAERRRIWEASSKNYVPRPLGVPPKSVLSVLEIGMQYHRAQQQSSS
ncbi:hypothetical protein FRC07_015009 [Ceratobasidium sp. 392]|nr:hypothetical protein FRC07_015009 [Ceratobasidium sp. 392]